MNNAKSNPATTTANYISIILLTIVALSGTVYIIFSAIVSPPFDIERSAEFATKKEQQCVAGELVKRNIPHEVAEHREVDWVVLRDLEDRRELESIRINECATAK